MTASGTGSRMTRNRLLHSAATSRCMSDKFLPCFISLVKLYNTEVISLNAPGRPLTSAMPWAPQGSQCGKRVAGSPLHWLKMFDTKTRFAGALSQPKGSKKASHAASIVNICSLSHRLKGIPFLTPAIRNPLVVPCKKCARTKLGSLRTTSSDWGAFSHRQSMPPCIMV